MLAHHSIKAVYNGPAVLVATNPSELQRLYWKKGSRITYLRQTNDSAPQEVEAASRISHFISALKF
jgi:hypothetical protein